MARNIGDIAAQEMRPAAAFSDALDRLMGRIVVDNIVDGDVSARLREGIGDGSADAAPATRYEHALALAWTCVCSCHNANPACFAHPNLHPLSQLRYWSECASLGLPST